MQSSRELITMVLDGRALVLASLVNSGLGAIYWFVSARFYPTAEVGIASTMINTALTLATVSNLALGSVIERLLPIAGRLQLRLVTIIQIVTVTLSVSFAGLFILIGPDTRMFNSNWERLLFITAVPVLAQYTIQDSILIGLQLGRINALRNVLHAVVKLALISALAAAGTATGIVMSWIIPSLIGVIIVQLVLLVSGQFIRRDRHTTPQLPPTHRIISFNLLATVWMVVQALPGVSIPVIIICETSAEDAAYYNLSWTIVTASTVLISAVAGPFVSAASHSPEQLGSLTKRFIVMYLRISVLRTLIVAAGGPVLMWVYGADYARQATPLLLLIALGQAVSTSAYIYGNLERVNGRIGFSALLQGIGATILIGSAAVLVPFHGLVGAGVAYLIHDIYLLIASAPRAVILIRSMLHGVLPDNRLRPGLTT